MRTVTSKQGSKSKRTKKRKQITKAALEKRVWTVFSKYIRHRDALNQGTPGVSAKCVTCKESHPLKGGSLHAGHFISRTVRTIKFDEYNVHAQCQGCNYRQSGEQGIHAKYVIDTYGIDVFNKLVQERINHLKVKKKPELTRKELLDIEGKYLSLLKQYEYKYPMFLKKSKK